MTPGREDGHMMADRAVLTLKDREDMRHPPTAWTDPSYADEPLERLLGDYLAYLRGRAQPVSPGTVDKYRKTLVSFIRSLRAHGDEPTLAALTTGAVNRWITDQRQQGRSEDGIASRLVALKVFSNEYLHRELELTTCDLLRKVPRITPPDRPAQVLTEQEREQVPACFAQPTFEDIRNRALVAVYMATGLRFKEVLELTLANLDQVHGDIVTVGKGGPERRARLSPRALKYVRDYLRERPRDGESDRLWLQADGSPLGYWGGMSIMRRLRERSGIARLHWHLFRHGFAQAALGKGAHPGMVQEMLGHATSAMTRKYLGPAKQTEAARQMPAYSPI
jgi:site-specific recombinase XerD